jgi:hypothetical protein
MQSSTVPEVREWLDRLAVEALIHRYADSVTRADWPQCESVFAPHATWESPLLGMRFDRDAFLDMLRETAHGFDLLIQTVSSPVVHFDGPARATATTTVHELVRGVSATDTALAAEGSAVNIEQYGIYCDQIERFDDQWLFVHRLFVPMYVDSGRVTGDVMAARPSLAALTHAAA